uniref:Secreted protein n=1 Tax=Caenorhabditis tropicalis TaxID=1561998 RepID=A0A1I7T6T4_9PELO
MNLLSLILLLVTLFAGSAVAARQWCDLNDSGFACGHTALCIESQCWTFEELVKGIDALAASRPGSTQSGK